MIIGLTGGSGTGKSTVSSWFEKKGYVIIDGDKVSRQITTPGSPALQEIVEAFGDGYLESDGSLNRKKLGAFVFSNENALNKLNEITHKYITKEVKNRLKNVKKAVIEGAAIHECDIFRLCDLCIFVSCPKEEQLKRIMKRDGLTEDYARMRLMAQKSDAYYRKVCDIELVNDGKQSIEQQLEGLELDQ